MTQVMKISRLEDTTLWKCLTKHGADLPHGFPGILVTVCQEASERMKAVPAYMPQYTLHDERHLLRTTELMALILGSKISELNGVELALLILAAFFHDQGMVPSDTEYSEMQADAEFQLRKDQWIVEHPNYSEVAKQFGDSSLSEAEKLRLANKIAELDSCMLTDFLRETHASRSAKLVCEYYGNAKRLEIQGVNVAALVARLCESHALPVESLIAPPRSFRFDEQVGTSTINMPYLAVVLRLADILDFDRDRTPESLLKSIHFTSELSLQEWEKHRAVEGWTISPARIRFTMKSKHPVYEASARQYMDWIDTELATCQELLRSQPAEFDRYCLDLPTHVDRSRIEALDNATVIMIWNSVYRVMK